MNDSTLTSPLMPVIPGGPCKPLLKIITLLYTYWNFIIRRCMYAASMLLQILRTWSPFMPGSPATPGSPCDERNIKLHSTQTSAGSSRNLNGHWVLSNLPHFLWDQRDPSAPKLRKVHDQTHTTGKDTSCVKIITMNNEHTWSPLWPVWPLIPRGPMSPWSPLSPCVNYNNNVYLYSTSSNNCLLLVLIHVL